MHMNRKRLLGLVCALGLAIPIVSGEAAPGKVKPKVKASYPKAGVLVWTKVAARTAPSRKAPLVKVLEQFRPDYRPTAVLAVGEARDKKGIRWVKISMPMRPNGKFGWVKAVALQLHPVHKRMVIDRSARTLTLMKDGKRLFTTRVAVGKPGAETPLGRFYLAAAFKATAPVLGEYAFETSAYSNLSEWPGGGIIAIHGTPNPELLGQAVSHGCIRISNPAALRLKRAAPVGTPVSIVA